MSEVVHFSDCALHNEPYMPAGPCDCGAACAYTPGPWVLQPADVEDDGSVYPAHIVGGARGLVICYLTDLDQDAMYEAPGDRRSKSANARLISAAPEMYEALKALDAIFDLNPEEAADIADMLDINDHNHLREVCELVRDALSKASSPQAQEGKQGLSPASAEIAVAPQVVDPDGRRSDGGEGL